MSRTFYSVDRSPEIPAPKLEAWTVLSARNGFVDADPHHRQAVTAKEAATLCKALHGVSLSVAVDRGII